MAERLWRGGFWLLVLLVAVYVVSGLIGAEINGCDYGTVGCDDPSWGNFPPF